jgi:hypothetical protein
VDNSILVERVTKSVWRFGTALGVFLDRKRIGTQDPENRCEARHKNSPVAASVLLGFQKIADGRCETGQRSLLLICERSDGCIAVTHRLTKCPHF